MTYVVVFNNSMFNFEEDETYLDASDVETAKSMVLSEFPGSVIKSCCEMDCEEQFC